MSGAICGKINTNGESVSIVTAENMMDSLKMYKLDIQKTLNKNNMFMGCGLLEITNESKKEVLPLWDKEKGLIITADASIYNKKELCCLLNIKYDKEMSITDSQVILLSYEKWNEECPKYLVGDFAFVIYDEKEKKVLCVKDHMGSRSLYYSYENNIFSFSTIIEPLKNNRKLNERWICDFLALKSVVHQFEPEETIYNNIYQVLPATAIIIKNNKLTKYKYWNPLANNEVLKLKSDNDYIQEFKKVFFEAVNSRIDSSKEISIMLSGGLDSTSVACVAANILKNKEKNLISYTSIPMDGYKDDTSKYRFADESEYVNSLKDVINNLEINYCKSENKDSVSDIKKFTKILEQPYKTFQNIFWVNEIMEKVEKRNSKVLLTGQYGNFSISYGDFLVHIKTLLGRGHLCKVVKEVLECSKLYNQSPITTSKYIIRAFREYKNTRKSLSIQDKYENSPLKMELINKWNIDTRIEKSKYGLINLKCKNIKELRQYFLDPVMLTQIGNIESKMSLAHGIVQRDPTKDKRVVEFCLSLPIDQFVRNGEERLLIKRAMKEILPDKIRLNSFTKGLQSADWIQRLLPKQKYICDKLEEVIKDEESRKYLDIEKLKKQLKHLKVNSIDNNVIDMRMIIISLTLYEYLNNEAI
ncbi:asparagine synthase-related protein [Clostridium saccharobutylicum]|uniref:asparagine synthase (glutamine-hydrolyzing) n=1 Tax=Clostridium saccharobutylicum DSM 13864 TaxID=1345695 RepID=U5MTE2_CLOSA|nr:asparagine synthase-related protein [Clostridium saccharobutylicum]AGX43808.1 asparagine synthase [Clostridium saccharobutylicum DSM 13864]AQR91108.1 asparagine synthetase 3 [Clostridium saccharobutylicum]AQS01012.1 asparagine synthetase 3 [Clostridium saccharobutylicum]AQS10751.1 asparagine synthetase 3 [Clostridium saccharobutylicum]AQS14995.1 asparagine synthetase 3 [Clostridium saccharobutylicum]